MKCNIGKTDRIIRVVVGLIIFLLGFKAHSWWGLVGLLPILTAAVGHSTGYVPFNISTNKEESK